MFRPCQCVCALDEVAGRCYRLLGAMSTIPQARRGYYPQAMGKLFCFSTVLFVPRTLFFTDGNENACAVRDETAFQSMISTGSIDNEVSDE